MNRFLLPMTVAFSASSLLLVDSAIKGAAMLVFASLVVLILRRDSAATRHLVWLVAIVAMLFVPVLSALLPQWRVLPEWAVISEVAVKADRSDMAYTTHMPSSAPTSPVPSVTVKDLSQPAATIDLDLPADNVSDQSLLPMVESPGERVAWNWQNIVPLLWAVGFLFLMIRLLAARILLTRIQRRATIIPPGERQGVSPPSFSAQHFSAANASEIHRIIDTLTAAKTELTIRHRITLLIHPDKTIPVVWGIFRHRLLLPKAALQWSDEQLRSVLLHELAHIKRRDTLAQLLAQIACALHWFNPLVWFAAWRLHVERERACDDLVLASGVRASAYAEHLLNVATKLSASPWTQACGLAMARSSSLHERLAAVLSEKRNRRSVSTFVVAVCVLMAATILIPVAMLGAVDADQPGQAATPATEDSATVTSEANEEFAMKLPPGMEKHLNWSNPVNGIRAAVRIQTMDSPGIMGKERKIFVVIRNISNKPIRFCDTAIQETEVPAADTEGRTLYLSDNGETLLGIQRAESMRIDLVLQPRDIFSIDMFDNEKANEQGLKSGDVLAEGIVKVPSRALSAVLNIIHAPDGAWTGKLKTPLTRGAFAVEGPMPKSKEGKALFRYCIDHARLNYNIPGGLISRLHDRVQEFIRLNYSDEFGGPYARKMQPLAARFEKSGDWTQADVVALFDDIAVVSTIPLKTTLEQIRERTLQRGQRLPVSFEKANWGESLPSGLRMAWVLEPGAEKYHLGLSLKSRVLIHNSGKEPVAFVTRSFHQPEHKASKADGTGVQVEKTRWTTEGRPEPYRLHPGEYCEVHAPGIGIGPHNSDDEDWANIRPGSWILANEDDEIVFKPGTVMLSGDHLAQVNPDWWLEFIKERVNRDAPLPTDPKEREVILFRVVQDLFGNSPSPEEADAFYTDMSPEALDNFAQRLSERSWLTSVAGPIQAGVTKFRVLPEDPDVATRTRVAMTPGGYNLGEDIKFWVMQRTVGEQIRNTANIVWHKKGQESTSHNIPLPDGYETWAAAWMPGTTVLWVKQASGIRSYDFTDSAAVKEADAEPGNVPIPIRDAFPAVLATPEAPAAPKPAAAAPATATYDNGPVER